MDPARFRAALPPAALPYADVILAVADEANIDPFVLVGIGQQETLWGTAKALDVQGPGGTGDHGPRLYGPTTVARLGKLITVVGPTAPGGLTRVTPADGRGWGRGLMQIDWAAQADWFLTNPAWADPKVNLTKAASVFNGWRSFLTARVGPPTDVIAATIASYNTGGGNVLKSIRAGQPVDTTTAHGNYSARVLAFANAARTRYGSP